MWQQSPMTSKSSAQKGHKNSAFNSSSPSVSSCENRSARHRRRRWSAEKKVERRRRRWRAEVMAPEKKVERGGDGAGEEGRARRE
ncbi:hypothetical protein ACFX2I_015281 [Malus domestica]